MFNQDERLDLVASCRLVDKAVMGSETDFYLHIKSVQPDIIGLGYDQWEKEGNLRSELKKVGLGHIEIYRLKPYEKYRAKSTITKTKSVDF